METEEPSTAVLVVDDESNLLDLYGVWLEDQYTVYTATGRTSARERLDAGIEVVVLDRRMPEVPGDELLVEWREAGWTGPVGLVSAAEPDLDLLPLPFDAHLSKPVSRDDFRAVVETLVRVRSVDPDVRSLSRRLGKRTLLEAHTGVVALEKHEPYIRLVDEIEAARAALDEGRLAIARSMAATGFG